ncbi:MAG: type II toxin-antitoxin system VapC family toxin [Trueperaceae bacterium]
MIGLDTSFLVAVAVREHPLHGAAWAVFERDVRGRAGSVALAPQVLAEFVHVVTDARRFERPLPADEALAIAERWWTARETRQVEQGADAVALFCDWMGRYRLGRKRLLDTLLAATYVTGGVRRIATSDWRDFEVFDGLEVVHLVA